MDCDDKALKSKISEKFWKSIKEDAVTEELLVSDSMYVEIGLFRDIDLGAMTVVAGMSGEDTAREFYNVVLDNVDRYRNRIFFDPYFYFPHPEVTKNKVLDILTRQTELHDKVFAAAPPTDFLSCLRANLAINRNHSGVIGKTDDILLTINTWPLTLSDHLRAAFGMYISMETGVAVEFINIAPGVIPLKQFDMYQEYYVYNFKQFVENPEMAKAASSMHFFPDKRLFVVPVLGHEYMSVFSEAIKAQQLLQIETHMRSLFRQFSFIPTNLASPRVSSQTEEARDGRQI